MDQFNGRTFIPQWSPHGYGYDESMYGDTRWFDGSSTDYQGPFGVLDFRDVEQGPSGMLDLQNVYHHDGIPWSLYYGGDDAGSYSVEPPYGIDDFPQHLTPETWGALPENGQFGQLDFYEQEEYSALPSNHYDQLLGMYNQMGW